MAKETCSGIYCVEDVWPERQKMSARPLLDMLEDYHEIPTVHRIATNGKQLKERLGQWAKADMTFAILYLWYHGSPGSISPSGNDSVELEHIEEELEGCCDRCLIHFGSCEILKLDRERIDSFLERTGAVAVSGYRKNVGWIEPIALELLYLDCLQQKISEMGNQRYIDENIMRKVSQRMEEDDVRGLAEKLEFVIEIRTTSPA